MAHLGVAPNRQVYLGLPDGNLAAQSEALAASIADVADDFKPQRMFTLGPEGYDGHPDHIATHESAVAARRQLGALGVHMALLALGRELHAPAMVTAPSKRKLAAMALHISQRTVADLTRWGGGDTYTPVIVGPERYNQR